MKLLEYQSKDIFRRYGLPVPDGEVARTPEEVREIARKVGNPEVVLKAQVPVGGRGKAGGIKKANCHEDAYRKAKAMLVMKIKNIPVKKLLVEQALNIEKEYYASITIDRRTQSIVFMFSTEGGVDIEEVARTKPEAIFKKYFEISPKPYQIREWVFSILKNDKKFALKLAGIFQIMHKIFEDIDANLVEINPLVKDKEGRLWAADAKILVDDNALYRHPDIEKMRDWDYEEKMEYEAKQSGLSYVKLDGNIGCCVNGAGLAMATMDIIKYYGGEPANFLDIGGSSSPDKVKKALDIILSDPKVKVIFFNIFGGITRCDDVASGMVEVFKEVGMKVPVVIRLTGTNEDKGKEILKNSGLNFHIVESMSEGAKKAVELSKG